MRKCLLLGLLFAAVAFPTFGPAAAALASTDQNELVEFYNKSLDHYFITIGPKEIANLDSGVTPGWVRTGFGFPVVKNGADVPSTSPVCRFYGLPEAGIDSHFYSSKADECEQVKIKFPQQWQFEAAEVFRAFAVDPNSGLCPVDTSPVYRLWNQRADVNHRYTNQQSIYDAMIAKGYKAEGDGNPAQPVAFCQPIGASTVPPPAAGTPTCTLAVNSATPAVGSTLILTASCTNGPTAFAWTGCTSTSNSCQVTRTTAGAAKYVVTASNAAGPGTPLPIDVTWIAIGPMPVCSISANNPTPTVGSTLTLSANCSQSPTRIDWLECNSLIQGICAIIPTCSNSSTSCAISSNLAGFARYAVAGANASGTGARGAVDVEWKPAGGGGGGAPVLTPVCTAIASNENPNVGTSIVLTASCLNNPTSYSWTNVTCSQVQCATSSVVTGPQTYSVSGSNSAGTSAASFITINWGGASIPQTPACTLTASSLTPTVGQTVTIASSCTNSPGTYAWTGCAGTSANCSDASTATGAKTYGLTATNGAGQGTATIVVNWQGAPTAVPVCTVTSSSATAFVGQAVLLTATCNNSPQFYAWTNCNSNQPTCTAAASATGPQVYTIQAANAVGASTPVSTTVTWQQSTGGADFCGSFPDAQRVTKNWEDNNPIYTQSNGGFSSNGAYVVQFTVPSSPSSYGSVGSTDIAEFNGPPTFRHMTLSKSACDFRPVDPTGVSGPFSLGYGTSARINWNVGGQPVALVPGQTYYFNFRNFSPDINGGAGGVSCAGNACNAIIQLNFPKN